MGPKALRACAALHSRFEELLLLVQTSALTRVTIGAPTAMEAGAATVSAQAAVAAPTTLRRVLDTGGPPVSTTGRDDDIIVILATGLVRRARCGVAKPCTSAGEMRMRKTERKPITV